MKQIVQSIKNGRVLVIDSPPPDLQPGFVLVQNAASLVSAGTERMTVEFSKKNLLEKAKARPDLVKQFMDKAKRDGIISAFDAIKTRLDQPLPLGYASAGVVLDVGEGVKELRVWDKVACAGAGYANHAEIVCVPKNLVAKIPGDVDFESAAFSTLGAVALQGIRLSEVKIGEAVAVVGLGLLGQLTVQILKAAGCVVLGMDINEGRATLAKESGADWVSITTDDFINICNYFTSNKGVDSVLITAATQSNEPIELAGTICRDRGIVVAVGTVNLEIPRRLYYEKELDFRVSRSYGPGRYDPNYEEKGQDYPIGYVRWTEQRNMQAFLQLVSEGKVNVKKIISHRFSIDDAVKAYDLITEKADESYLGIVIQYGIDKLHESKVVIKEPRTKIQASGIHSPMPVSIGLLGCGNFPSTILLPAIKSIKNIEFIGAYDPVSNNAKHVAQKFGFKYCSGKISDVIDDSDINTVVIATRHNFHCKQVIASLKTGKNVFCEKPLCLNETELKEIIKTYNSITQSPITNYQLPILMVGYNRRFSPMAQKMKKFISQITEPFVINYRINAGFIPLTNWIQDSEQGGGRIIGEICHFIDYMIFLTSSLPANVYAKSLPNNGRYNNDNIIITLEFVNGSLGSISYLADGDKSFSKERIEVFGNESVVVLDNFRRLELIKSSRKKVHRSIFRQDKGHRGEWEQFVDALQNGKPLPISYAEIIATSLTTFCILNSLRESKPIAINLNQYLT